MGFWAAAIPIIKGVGSAVASGAVSNMFGQGNSAQANQMTRESQWHSYQLNRAMRQTAVRDLRMQGLNPILAASQGFGLGGGSVSAPAGAMVQPPNIDMASSAQGMATAKEKETNIVKIKNEANESLQRIAQLRQSQRLMSQQEAESIAKQFKLEKEFELLGQEIKNKEATELVNIAEYRRLNQVTNHLVAELQKLSKISDVYKGPAGKKLAYIKEILSSLNISFGMFGGLTKRR